MADAIPDWATDDTAPISNAILGQESDFNPRSQTSTDGAIGEGQILPATFAQYALPGEDINNPKDNLAVHKRIIDDLSNKAGGDPARIAVGYFSGPENIAPPDSPTPYLHDHKDGNGKSVSSYVSDVLGRLNPISEAEAAETVPEWAKEESKADEVPDWATDDKVGAGSDVANVAGSELKKAELHLLTSTPGSLASDLIQNTINLPIQGATRLAGAAYEGLGGELSMPQAQALTQGIPKFGEDPMALSIRNALEKKMDYQPQTTSGEVAQSSMGVAPYILGGEGSLARKLIGAGVAGAGTVAGKDAAQGMGFGEKGQQVGALLGGAPGLIYGNKGAEKPKDAEELPPEIPPDVPPVPDSMARPDIPIEAAQEPLAAPQDTVPITAEPYAPSYDFDTDSYVVAKPGAEPITGFDREEEAQAHADELNGMKSESADDGIPDWATEEIPVSAYKGAVDEPSLTPAQQRYLDKNQEHRDSIRSVEEAKLRDLESQVKPYEDGTYTDLSEDEIALRDDLRNRANRAANNLKDYDAVEKSSPALEAAKTAIESNPKIKERIAAPVPEQPAAPELGKVDTTKPAESQAVLPGAEAITDKQLAERKMAEPKKATVAQQAPNEGLFDTGAHRQTDLLDVKPSLRTKDILMPDGTPSGSKMLLDENGRQVGMSGSHEVEVPKQTMTEHKVEVKTQESVPPTAEGKPAPRQIAPTKKQRIKPLSPEEMQQYYTPGRIVKSYGGQDRVVKFNPATSEKPWSVDVEAVKPDGTPIPREGVRNHATPPSISVVRKVLESEPKTASIATPIVEKSQKTLTKNTIPPTAIGKPTSLSTFIKNNGGIKPDIHEASWLKKDHKDLLRQNGKTLDDMGQLAYEHGYFPERPALNDFTDTLERTNGGKEHFRPVDGDRISNSIERKQQAQENDPAYVEHVASQHGIDTKGKTTSQLKNLIDKALGEDSIVRRAWDDEGGAAPERLHTDIRDIVSPTMAGEGAKKTGMAIRRAYGEASRRRAQDETALKKFAHLASKLTGEALAKFYRYVEGRSKGVILEDKSLQGMADGIRDVYERTRAKLESMPEARQMRFVKDYFTHQWKDKAAAEKFINDFIAQQGSLRHLKPRLIPTIEEGLAAGLELKEPNPVRAVSSYLGSMNNYIASVEALRSIMNDLGGGYYAKGKEPEGYRPLVGHNAERIENAKVDPVSGKLVPARTLQLYAPEDVATIYNRFYSKGFESTKAKGIYEAARNAINANTMMELGLSTYHAGTITLQSLNQDMGRIAKNALAGDWKGVADAAKKLVSPAGLKSSHAMHGKKLVQQYRNLKDHGVDVEAMANHFAQANLHLGLDPLSRLSHRGFMEANKRGELPEIIAKLKEQATKGYGLGLLKSGAEVAGRVVSDVSAPLFNRYIPSIKMSSFADLMGDWLRQHPEASKEQIQVQQARIGNLVDDRFGELNMDNIYWNRFAKQVAGLTFRAPGWDLGLIRQVGGPPLDIYRMLHDAATGKKFNPDNLDRPLYLLGAAAVYAAMNSTMTYLKTGKPPSEQDLKDLVNYRTGGTYKTLHRLYPERGVLPGHGKEIQNLQPVPSKGPLSGLAEEASNKVASLPRNIYDIWMNKDWKGNPIYDEKSKDWVTSTPGIAQAAYLMKGFVPFAIDNVTKDTSGSNLSIMEKALGVKPAGAKIVARKELGNYLEKKK